MTQHEDPFGDLLAMERLWILTPGAVKTLLAMATFDAPGVLLKDLAPVARQNVDSISLAIRQLVQAGFVVADTQQQIKSPHAERQSERFSRVRLTATALETFELLAQCAQVQLRSSP